MKQYPFVLILIFFSLILALSASAQESNKLTPRAVAAIALPSTVSIAIGKPGSEIVSGSGFFVANDIVATNYHVVGGMSMGFVKISGGKSIFKVTEVIAKDEVHDLALIRVELTRGKPLRLGTDSPVSVGDSVFAIGNPEGLEGTFSQGIISSIRRFKDGSLIQITAPLSHGSSGGPILNERAEVIGIAVGRIEKGEALNFAIPVSLLNSLLSKYGLTPKAELIPEQVTPISSKFDDLRKESAFPVTPAGRVSWSAYLVRETDLVTDKLFGRVKQVKENTYKPKPRLGEWINGKPTATQMREYNQEGFKTLEETVCFSKDCDPWVEVKNVLYGDGTKRFPLSSKTVFSYNFSKGEVTAEEFFKCALCKIYRPVKKERRIYSSSKVTTYDAQGNVTGRTITRIETNGRRVVDNYEELDELSTRDVFYQTAEGNVKETVWKDGRLFRKTITSFSGSVAETRVFCPEKQGVDQCGLDIDDQITGLPIRSATMSGVVKYVYEFDSHGNWTKQTTLNRVEKFGAFEFEPTSITTRELVYYN